MADGLPRMRIREGCRGGSEQFTWNVTKKEEFKDREQYLGVSMKVGLMGKFGRYYIHDWYAKNRETTSTIDEEKDAVKAYEEELMQEALGMKPKKLLLARRQLSDEEMRTLLKKDSEKLASEEKGRAAMGGQKKVFHNESGEEVAASNEDLVWEGSKDAPIKGLGFANHRTARLEAIKAATLGTKGELEGSSASSFMKKEEIKTEVKPEIKSEAFMDSDSFTLGGKREKKEEMEERDREVKGEDDTSREAKKRPLEEVKDVKEERQRGKAEKKDDKKQRKAEKKLKKLAKKEKKAAKKEKKAAKKALKAAKRAKKSSSSSSSSS